MSMREWTIFTRADGLIGMLPSFVKKLPEGAEILTTFSGTEQEAIKYIEKYEEENGQE